jgi:hypothetical protein
MASPFPRLTPPHFFAPVKMLRIFTGAKKRRQPRALCAIIAEICLRIKKISRN